MQIKKQNLFITLVLPIFLTIAVIMSFYSFYNYSQMKTSLYKQIKTDSSFTLKQLEKVLPYFIESYSINEYENLLKDKMENKNILAIIVKDYNLGKVSGKDYLFRGKIRDNNFNVIEYDLNNKKHNEILMKNYLKQSSDIFGTSNEKIAEVFIYNTDYLTKKDLDNFVEKSIVEIVILVLILIFLLFILLKRFILNPIYKILQALENRDDIGLPQNIIPKVGSKELCNLASSMNSMIKTIKTSKEKLKESEFRWKFAIEGNNDGLWDWNIKTSKVFFSKQLKDMLGYHEDEFKGFYYEWEKRIHPDDFDRVKRALNNYLNDCKQKYNIRYRILCKDGTYKWILDRGVVVKKDENNKPLRMIGTHNDISEEIESEKKLKYQKEEFETIFNYSKDGIAIIDLDTNFLKFNDSYLALTGFSKEELLSKSCFELTAPEDVSRTKEALKHVLKYGFIESFEKTCIIKKEKRIDVNVSISLLPDKKRLLMVTKDISSIKLLHEQSKLASMGEMIGNIAHQWRQPLSIITTSASGLKLKSEMNLLKKEEILVASDNIVEQSNYLSKTIDSFRNYIKGDKSFTKISIKEVLENSLSLVNASLQNNYIDLILDIDNDIKIDGNKNELTEAFINILNNSKDALKSNIKNEEDRLLFISTKKELDKNFIVEILDSGGGIDKSIIDKIFDPYFTTKHKFQGTGLGLSMASKIIRQRHKGKIDVYNKEFTYNNKRYKGACFLITFNSF